jgi:hypothetical protein
MIKVIFHSILAQVLGFSLGVMIGYLFGASEWFYLVVLLSHLFGALFVSVFLKLRRTWIYFNALVPLGILLITVAQLPVPSTLLCLVTLFLAFLFIPTISSGVPYYPTNRIAYQEIIKLIPLDRPTRFIDLGCGFGTLLLYISKHRPLCKCVGIEISPMAWFTTKIRFFVMRNLKGRKCHVKFKDLFSYDLSSFDFVYTFLAPPPMPRIWEKAKKEMPKGSIFISNTFEVPSTANKIIPLDSSLQTNLYIHRM